MKTRRVPREELAKFLPNERLIRAFELMTQDLLESLPSALAEVSDEAHAAALDAAAGRSTAQDALALALGIGAMVELLASGPHAQVAALREEVAELRAQIVALQLIPT